MSDRRKTCRKTLILGIGNSLLQDEGAGVHAIRLLATSSAAFVHPGYSVTGLSAGLVHSFYNLSHLLVILAAGLWVALRGGRMSNLVNCATRVTGETISPDTGTPKHAHQAAGDTEVRKIHRSAT